MQLTVLHEDVFSSRILGKFDGIVSNPPYIPTRELQSLQPEIRFVETLEEKCVYV